MLQSFFSTLALVFFTAGLAVSGQQPDPGSPSTAQSIRVNVQVALKSGVRADDLTQQDFTVLDNKEPQAISSFKLVTPAQEPVEVILLLDEVNSDYNQVMMQRDGVRHYLRSNGGKLPFPTIVAVLNDHGAQIQKDFSTDGVSLADDLAHFPMERRELTVGSEWGDFDRVRMSLVALHQIAHIASMEPGRKLVLDFSPGWPLLSGPRFPMVAGMQKQFFSEIVAFSTQLQQANVTLYTINVAAVAQMRETSYYEGFLKGVSKPSQVQVGNVGLQVLTEQSGGTVEQSSTDVGAMIRKCELDASSWYEIGFDPPPADKPDGYHHIEIKLDKPGLKARTRDGYYANPTVDSQR